MDKTLLIKDLFNPPALKLITAPRGFGKSTNMNMVKRFLQINIDEKGNPIERTRTINYKLFKENNLMIYKQTTFFMKHFGKHPVLFIDYKPLSSINSFENLLIKLRIILHKTFNEHKYLVQNSSLWLNEGEKKSFVQYIRPELSLNLTEAEITDGFAYLSRLLFAHFDKRIFVLIDAYDSFLNSVIFKEPDDDIVALFQTINSVLLKTKYVGNSFLTGVLRITGKGLSLPGVVIQDYYFLDNHTFSVYYGLTENELDKVLNDVIQDDKERNKTKNNIQEYYCGYIIRNQNTEIYNIMSVFKYIQTKRLSSYWHFPEYLNIFKTVFTSPDILHIMKELLFGNTIEIDISNPITEQDILMLNHIIHSGIVQSVLRMTTFISFLNHIGYLSSNKVFQGDEIPLKIPNEEVKYELANIVANIYTELYRFSPLSIQNFQSVFDSFRSHKENQFDFLCKSINDLFNSSIFKPHTETEYQSVIYLYVLTRTEYSHTRTFADSETTESLVGHTQISLKNKHGVYIYMNVKGSLVFDEEERTKKAGPTLKKIIDHQLHEQFDEKHKKVYIGVCFDIDRRASIAYSYYFKEGDKLEDFKVIS